jgi:TetR/AcrR family transcriptional regulator, cholesterol catabolism regulator
MNSEKESSKLKPDGAVTAKRLLDLAARLFWENGYAATTTRELAEALGVQKASLYYHMGSKEDLLYEICMESLANIHEAVSQAVSEVRDPMRRVQAMIHAHVLSMLEDREKHATMLTELKALSPSRRSEVVARRDQYETLVRGILSDAQDAEVLTSEIPAKQLELGLLNLLNWTIFWYQADGDLSPDEVARLLERLYVMGARRFWRGCG